MMNDRPPSRQPDPSTGLCATCRFARVVTSDRGSRFVLCARAATDPAYRRYPVVPVRACPGWQPVDPA